MLVCAACSCVHEAAGAAGVDDDLLIVAGVSVVEDQWHSAGSGYQACALFSNMRVCCAGTSFFTAPALGVIYVTFTHHDCIFRPSHIMMTGESSLDRHPEGVFGLGLRTPSSGASMHACHLAWVDT